MHINILKPRKNLTFLLPRNIKQMKKKNAEFIGLFIIHNTSIYIVMKYTQNYYEYN